MREAIAQHGAAAAAVGLIDEQRREVELLADDGYPPGALEVLRRFSLDAPIPAAAAARTSSPVLVGTLAERRQRFPRLPTALGDGSVAIACLPLRVADRTFGVLILRYTGERAFGSDERRFLLTLADDCSQALDRARLHAETERLYEREHRIAETLQASLLPAEFPLAPGVDFAAYFAPMGDGSEVGGDFYDVFEREAGYTALVGDVCGKGPEAARLTALCRYTLRAAGMVAETSPCGTLALLNRAILEQAPEAGFCTVVLADLVATSDETMSVTISTAGHPPPLVIRRTGEVEELPIRGCVLGAVEEPALVDSLVQLAAGDALMFVTDGVEETRRPDGAFYGHERVCGAIERVLRAGGGGTAAALIDALRGDLDEFRGSQSPRDDVVILAVRFEGN
jgi:serine phosphatase RsbU (regulator of sigma subunit)